jgi:hypothetical protein
MDEWIKGNVVYILNGVLFSSKEEMNHVICRKMVELEIMLSKTSPTQKQNYGLFSITCRI